MHSLRPYDARADKRVAGNNRDRLGLCSTVWCRRPAIKEWTTNGGQTRYVCAHHEQNHVTVAAVGGFPATGAGDGRYHNVPFLKKYGA